MGVPLRDRLQDYAGPMLLLIICVIYLPITLVSHPLLLLTSPSSFRSKWFENFWTVLGPKMAADKVQMTEIHDLLSRAHGKVLEVGPGGGDQMYHYNPRQIETLWAAEPNVFLHPKLLQAADKNGLRSKFIALEAGAEPGTLLPALKRANLISGSSKSLPKEGVFDTIVVVKALCSSQQSQLASTLAIFQALLKPGGQFLFFEHVESNSDPITVLYASALNLIWPAFAGGCQLKGKVDKLVLGMGGWADRKVTTVGDHKGHEVWHLSSFSLNTVLIYLSPRCSDTSRELLPKLDLCQLG